MKIRFTPRAQKQLDMIKDLDPAATGFVSGIEIGKYVIIENLVPVNFDESNIDEVYSEIYSKTGEKLIGPFFKNNTFFKNEWFLSDIIIEIGEKKCESYLYKG